MRIKSLKHGNLNEQDRLFLANLLIKAGYVVNIGKEKVGSKVVHYVEAIERIEELEGVK
jgi:hypothetical protein